MQNIRLFIFDLEGTLLQPNDIITEAIYGAIEETNAKFELDLPYPDEQQIAALVGQPDFRIIEAIDPHLEAEPATYMRTLMDGLMRELIEEGSASLYDGALYALKTIKAADGRIGIVCNYSRDYLIAVLDYFNLYDYVDFSVCIEDIGRTEAKWMLDDVVNNQLVLPSETVFITDRAEDIRAAHELDMRAIGCAWGFGSAEEIAEADSKVDSLYELVELFKKAS